MARSYHGTQFYYLYRYSEAVVGRTCSGPFFGNGTSVFHWFLVRHSVSLGGRSLVVFLVRVAVAIVRRIHNVAYSLVRSCIA